ncbi:DUF4870 domain-containing protein [bacterium]|nr:DUF4870 domain-containing protein [bacterium]
MDEPIVDALPPQEEPEKSVWEPTGDERTMALLVHIGGIITGFIVPLIIWLIKKDESDFVDHHGQEALNFQITVLIAMFVSAILTYVVIDCLLLSVVMIADIVFGVLAAVAANKGEWYKYPVSIRIVS